MSIDDRLLRMLAEVMHTTFNTFENYLNIAIRYNTYLLQSSRYNRHLERYPLGSYTTEVIEEIKKQDLAWIKINPPNKASTATLLEKYEAKWLIDINNSTAAYDPQRDNNLNAEPLAAYLIVPVDGRDFRMPGIHRELNRFIKDRYSVSNHGYAPVTILKDYHPNYHPKRLFIELMPYGYLQSSVNFITSLASHLKDTRMYCEKVHAD